LKILVLHNLHRKGSSSGDDQVFKDETRLLEKYGNTVIRYTISNDSFDNVGIIGKIKACLGMLWSFKCYKDIQDIILRENPDIVHVHTFFPLMSPSVLYAAKRNGCKVVATLHDTRFICPCCTSLRGTTICNECGDGHYLRMFKYGCFKGSRIQSLIVAFIFKYHRIRRSFYNQIDKYICLNNNQIKLLEEIGFDKKKIVKKYNFVSDALQDIRSENNKDLPERYVVFYGRIGEEKGIRVLMKAWEEIDIPLVVMGSGPLEEEFKTWADTKENVYFLGYTAHHECLKIVKNSEFVVFPSIWYEGCSMVQIETMSLGKVLVATNLGFSEEAIKEGYNGTKFELGNVDDFIIKIQHLWNMPESLIEMERNARKDFEDKYLPEDNYIQLINIYNSVL
jgi:glycosyltransferase involved in cell wall biosynthesis